MTRDCRSAAMAASVRRSARSGVHMGAELRVLLIALLFLVATDVDVRSITTANAQAPGPELQPRPELKNFTTFNELEADALNAVLKNWTSGGLNQQLSSILNWSLQQHPCNVTDKIDYYNDSNYEGSWRGVYCTPLFQDGNSTGNYYFVSVTSLQLYGSEMSCGKPHCDFEGIRGVLPCQIAQLTNLTSLDIKHHPDLTGAVPLQIWQMPKLTKLHLANNALQGTLPSSSTSLSSSLKTIDLTNNSFSGMLEVSFDGTLLSSSLIYLYLGSNRMHGPVDLRRFTNKVFFLQTLNLSNNHFNGTFSTGPYFNPQTMDLSNNFFTSIEFSNYSGSASRRNLDTSYMPYLEDLYATNNSFSGSFPSEFGMMPRLERLDLSGNQLASLFPAELVTNLTFLDVSRNCLFGSLDFRNVSYVDSSHQSLNFSKNCFNGSFFCGHNLNTEQLDISDNYFIDFNFDNESSIMDSLELLFMGNNSLKGEFPKQILEADMLKVLDVSRNEFSGSLDFDGIQASNNSQLLNFSKNHFNGSFSSGQYLNPKELDLSDNNFIEINFSAYYSGSQDDYMPALEKLSFTNYLVCVV